MDRGRAGLVGLSLLSAVLLVLSLGDLLAVSAAQRRADALEARAFARIDAADALTLALEDGSTEVVREHLARLARLSGDDPEQTARVREMASAVAEPADGRRRVGRAVLAYRQTERGRVLAYRAGVAAFQRIGIVAAVFAVALAFASGGAGVLAWTLRRRRELMRTLSALANSRTQASPIATLLEEICAATPDLIYAKDLECRFIYANPAVLREIGRDWKAVEGHTIEELIDYSLGDELPSGMDRRVMASGQPQLRQVRHVQPDGVGRHFRSMKFPLHDAAGAVTGVAGVSIETTEMQAAEAALAESAARLSDIAAARAAAIDGLEAREARLKWILESVPDAMIVIDERGAIQEFSEAAEKLFGWTAGEVVGRNVSLLMPEPDRSAHDGYLARYLATGERRIIGIGRTVQGERRDGSVFPMELAVGEIRSGAHRHFTGFVRDLTERQAAERRFRDMQAELAHVSRLSAMGEMASALAHELNQPLSATANYVQGAARLLDRTPIDRELIREGLTLAAEEMFRAGDIIRHMRDFVARGETEERAEDLAKLLQEAGALATVATSDRRVRFSYEIPPSAAKVMVDRVQIQQVVLNLMRNAIEAMADSPRRELNVSAGADADGLIRVSVRDTGPGISDEVAAQLFQPFVTTKQDGMGVGLSLSRTIVEAHGGRIWAEPAPGGGAIFSFTVRAAHETAESPVG